MLYTSIHTAAGHSLFDRLGRPILPGEEFQSPNEQVQKSRSYLEDKLQSLEKRFTEVEGILPQQEQLLREFITYCQFEKRIEMVCQLIWGVQYLARSLEGVGGGEGWSIFFIDNHFFNLYIKNLRYRILMSVTK